MARKKNVDAVKFVATEYAKLFNTIRLHIPNNIGDNEESDLPKRTKEVAIGKDVILNKGLHNKERIVLKATDKELEYIYCVMGIKEPYIEKIYTLQAKDDVE
jgi:hypothetical protein